MSKQHLNPEELDAWQGERNLDRMRAPARHAVAAWALAAAVALAALLGPSMTRQAAAGLVELRHDVSAHARECSVITDTPVPNPTPEAASRISTVSPLPSRPPIQQMTQPLVSEGQIGAAPNPRRVTGYGPSGIGRIPGSPPDPPYH